MQVNVRMRDDDFDGELPMDHDFRKNEVTEPKIFKIIYRSKIAEDGGHEAVMKHIKQILVWSRDWNPRHGVTGALMLDEDGFAQVIEGPPDAIKSLFGHIVVDKRHTEVEVIEAGYHAERDFGGWSMAFVGGDGQGDIQLANTARRSRPDNDYSALGVISLLRWFLEEQH